MIKKEVDSIYNSDTARRGRDYETIKFSVRQGKIAELYLIENYGYSESDIRWHDLKKINENGGVGEYVEIKAYSSNSIDAGYLDAEIRRIKNSSWNYSKYLIAFKVDHGEYSFYKKIDLRWTGK